MPPPVRKIINDPVYGFITIDHPLILDIISHPVYQRLRNIHQMAFAHLVYPGAVHSRLHHSLGAYHLMCTALTELKSKGVDITTEEELGCQSGYPSPWYRARSLFSCTGARADKGCSSRNAVAAADGATE